MLSYTGLQKQSCLPDQSKKRFCFNCRLTHKNLITIAKELKDLFPETELDDLYSGDCLAKAKGTLYNTYKTLRGKEIKILTTQAKRYTCSILNSISSNCMCDFWIKLFNKFNLEITLIELHDHYLILMKILLSLGMKRSILAPVDFQRQNFCVFDFFNWVIIDNSRFILLSQKICISNNVLEIEISRRDEELLEKSRTKIKFSRTWEVETRNYIIEKFLDLVQPFLFTIYQWNK